MQVLLFKVLTYSIINGVSMFVCTCVVSMCCVWCPCVVTAVLSSSSSSGLTSQELCSTPIDTWCTQHDLRAILLFIHPLAIFPTTFDLFQWLAATHNHIPTQNSTIFTHMEWEPVHWQRPMDGPPPTPCDTPTVRKALLGLKSHRRWVSTKTNFICHGTANKKYLKTQMFAGISFQSNNMYTITSTFMWPHIYMYMLNVGSTTSTHLH